jgi:Winged helix DNA-binding domain
MKAIGKDSDGPLAERVLTSRELNRALLARQLLLERKRMSIPKLLEQTGGLQTQYAPSGYVGLWTRLEGFERDALTRSLERRAAVQATLMRVTIHLVSTKEYWLFAMGLRRWQRDWWLRTHGRTVTEGEMKRYAPRLRRALADGPKSVAELGDLAKGFLGNLGLWVELVRVPPSGTWERRRADLLGLAEDWVGPCAATEKEGLEHLVRCYLRGFGPAAVKDVSSWAGVPVTPLKAAAERMQVRRFRDEAGKELIDLPRAPLPDPDTPAPVRFLPHWDATMLVHARRALILPEPYRERVFSVRNPFSVGTFLVDGQVAGAWRVDSGRIVVDQYERLARGVQKELEEERERLQAFHA